MYFSKYSNITYIISPLQKDFSKIVLQKPSKYIKTIKIYFKFSHIAFYF